MKKKLIILILLFLILLGLFLMFSIKIYHNSVIWNEHKDYFKLDETNQKIENWMSIRIIEKKFKINAEKELGLNLTFYEKRLSLLEICEKYNLDSKKILEKLNKK